MEDAFDGVLVLDARKGMGKAPIQRRYRSQMYSEDLGHGPRQPQNSK